MIFGHEKLDVYRLSLEYIKWVFEYCDKLTGNLRHARDQLLRASQSIPLNIAEGNGKTTDPDRRKYFHIARGSALECAAIQDVLETANVLEQSENQSRKIILSRIVAMLTRLSKTPYCVEEEHATYGEEFDSDNDSRYTDSDRD